MVGMVGHQDSACSRFHLPNSAHRRKDERGIKGCALDFRNEGHKGHIVYSTSVHSDPTYFPLRMRGEERVLSFSGAG
jgi:hypothetical protein